MILADAAMFGHAVTIIWLPVCVMETVTELGRSQTPFILALMLLVFFLGMFLETIAISLITTPIPSAMTELGIENPR
jgi:C4-dicarboxylate transporter, DctM subunit